MSVRIPILAVTAALGALPAFAAPVPPSPPPTSPCVDVQIGHDRTAALNCLNQSFQRDVAREHSVPQPEAPVDVHSSSTQLGTANETAARQRMGNTFGVSASPQRPVRVFVPTLPMPPAH
jgi:hypothetical protein